jgi:glycosyltransferase involved in cell wall biosynthesis
MSRHRRRRFCLVTTFYPPESFGGDGAFVRQLAHELVARGHPVDVVYNSDAFRALGPNQAGVRREESPPGLTIHALSAGLGPIGPLLIHQSGQPWLLRGQLERILKEPFDVVHFHNVSLIGGPGVLRYGSGIKLYTTHEAWLVCPTHTLFRFNREPCVRPHCVACSLIHRRPPQWWRFTGLLRRALGQVDAFLAPSTTIARLHRERNLDLPFVEIPNFVSEPPDRGAGDSGIGSASERPFFLFAGRLERLKGVHTLLPVFSELADRADLIVAGAGSEERSLRAASGGNVRFTGWLEPDRLTELYRRAVAVVVPSLCHETFGLVALEALREATPIVVPDRGSLAEIAGQSGGGLLYRNEAGLTAALRRLLDDRSERDRLGAAGQRAWRARWTADAHLERYFEIIERLEGGKTAV